MSQRPRPRYTNKNSTQSLREALDEYYTVNSDFTHPSTLPEDFGKIMLAHDVSHAIYGCDTGMYDELKLLPLTFWTSDYKFRDYIRSRKTPAVKAMVDAMYDDLIKRHGVLRLYGSILVASLQLLPEVISIWFKTRGQRKYVPFFDFEPLFDRSLLDIRQDFDLLGFIK